MVVAAISTCRCVTEPYRATPCATPFVHLPQADGLDAVEKEAAAWAPRSPEELTLELQLACVHPRVCILAATAGIGVPDPEDAFSPLANKKVRCLPPLALAPLNKGSFPTVGLQLQSRSGE